MPMNQKNKYPFIGSKTIIFDPLKPLLLHNSKLLSDKLPLTCDFAYIAANGFTGRVVFRLTCPTTDYQQHMSVNSQLSIFIGQQ